MTLRIAVVHEAKADYLTATELADRVLVEQIDWLEADAVAFHREWQTENPEGRPLTWTAISALAKQARIRAHGHFEGKPGDLDAAAARRAILYLQSVSPDLRAVLLLRDQDDQTGRWDGLNQARDADRSGWTIVIGLAVVERECWVICGFDPSDSKEEARLDDERKRLHFDPRERSHELTDFRNDHTDRSPKRVLRSLSCDDRGRERDCWVITPLDVLRKRGGANGLAVYLEDVRDRLVPLVGPAARDRT